MTKPSPKPSESSRAHSVHDTAACARRRLVQSSTLAAAAALLGLGLSACGGGDDKGGAAKGSGGGGSGGASGPSGGTSAKGGAGGGVGGGMAADPKTDPLNALLESTYLVVTAYSAAIGLLTDAVATDPLVAERDLFVQLTTSIQANHRVHASLLVEATKTAGGTPSAEASVVARFAPPAGLIANTSIANALKFVASSEREAAVRTNQILVELTTPELRALASSIEGMQAQHFIVLAALVAGLLSPGPNLDETSAASLFPSALVLSDASHAGLDQAPPDYFG